MILNQGVDIPHYKTAERKGRRKLNGMKDVWLMASQYNVPFYDFLEACSIGLTDLGDLVKAASDQGKKGANVEALREQLTVAGILQGGESYVTLTREKQ